MREQAEFVRFCMIKRHEFVKLEDVPLFPYEMTLSLNVYLDLDPYSDLLS